MRDIVIYEDGKISRGSRAVLLKRGNKRILIQFETFNYRLDKYEITTEWFKVFNPSWSKSSNNKRNNKRKFAIYYHEASNEFYSDYRQTDKFIQEVRDYNPDYCSQLYGQEFSIGANHNERTNK